MRKTCENCKFWSRDNNEVFPDEFGSCLSGKLNDISDPREMMKEYDTDNLLYHDYEGYSADLVTGKDFGCVHFKEKIN